ncbi:MAG: protein phosphatase 2C domain-containing protein [Sandaracinaceae bacterium]|nr:protein phosphatase 2C domain-containing protein [Sandaracinaceae bacterium]
MASDDPFEGSSFNDETLPVLRPRNLSRSLPRPPSFEVAGRSDVGLVREQNEDTFLIAELGRWLEVKDTSLPVPDAVRRNAVPQGTLLMVADGMGGHGGGEVASAVAVDTIAQFALTAMPWVVQPDDEAERQILTKLGDAMSQCQQRLQAVALRKNMQEMKMGTTLTIAYVLWPKLYVAHAGDSRLYLHRDGELVQITRDHTVGQALRDSGAIGAGPSRFDHILVNVVGGGTDHVKAEAHSLSLVRGDRILLCSDGLTGHVSDATIGHELADAEKKAAAICEKLIEDAKAGGGLDNITVVVASF